MKKISCIIPAYNEATRISRVLAALKAHPLIDEIIVVDDCSTDNTQEHLRVHHSDVTHVLHEVNKGKSATVVSGIMKARNDIIMLIDADLVGLTAHNITKLAEPVLSGEADMSISLRKNSLLIYRLIGLDFVSGERVFHRSLIEDHLSAIVCLPGFGLEVFLNRRVLEEQLRLSVVWWSGAISPRKWKKVGLWAGTIADIRMIGEILKVISLKEVIAQHYGMLRLIVRPKRKQA